MICEKAVSSVLKTHQGGARGEGAVVVVSSYNGFVIILVEEWWNSSGYGVILQILVIR